MRIISVGSLFSGIGGIELGLEKTKGFKTKWFVENNEYAQAVLRKHWPKTPIHSDITKVNFKKLPKVDMLTGGFPCQDISVAGKGKGISGERSGLWSEYFRAICEIRPKYAIIENVPNLANKGLTVVIANLAEAGYSAEWGTIRASDVGALHRRERMFIIAYPDNYGVLGQTREKKGWGRVQTKSDNYSVSNTGSFGFRRRVKASGFKRKAKNGTEVQGRSYAQQGYFFTHDFRERVQRFREKSLQGKQGFSWCKDVRRVEDLQGRQDIPEPLFRGGRDGIPCWKDRIRCIGNAVVPQVAEFIGEMILEANRK